MKKFHDLIIRSFKFDPERHIDRLEAIPWIFRQVLYEHFHRVHPDGYLDVGIVGSRGNIFHVQVGESVAEYCLDLAYPPKHVTVAEFLRSHRFVTYRLLP